MEFDFTLTGRNPLLMSADNIEAADELKEWLSIPENKKLSTPGDDRTPPWTWMGRLHSDGEHLAIPSAVVMATLREAGKKMTLKGQTTFKGESQSALFMAAEYCDLLVKGRKVQWAEIRAIRDKTFAEQCKEVEKMGFKLFSKRVAVERKKHLRVRAKFADWKVVGHIEITETTITEDILNTLFRLAGAKCGFLDWRPNAKSPGSYGTFEHKLVRVA